tara:strand:+ start:4089 stop:4418 length:330 start_codon:yes stop_codon:yes gene_type:complete
MKATHTLKATTKGWSQVKPKTQKEKRNMLKKYGKMCFLRPDDMKYPICDKTNGKIDCRGIRSAIFWAQTNHIKSKKRNTKPKYSYSKTMKKGINIGKRMSCKLQNRTLK